MLITCTCTNVQMYMYAHTYTFTIFPHSYAPLSLSPSLSLPLSLSLPPSLSPLPSARLMDYDTYTAHDAIGKVYICLNPLADSGSTNTLDGWFPIFDTLHGVRGEVRVIVKVEIIKDQHRFRQSSCGIRFFACEYNVIIPGLTIASVHVMISGWAWFERSLHPHQRFYFPHQRNINI